MKAKHLIKVEWYFNPPPVNESLQQAGQADSLIHCNVLLLLTDSGMHTQHW